MRHERNRSAALAPTLHPVGEDRHRKDVIATDLTKVEASPAADPQVEDLRLQVRNLERLLGQRTLEIALLKEKLGKVTDDDASS